MTPKGWTGIKELDGKPIEGSFRSHQVPVEDVRENPEQSGAARRTGCARIAPRSCSTAKVGRMHDIWQRCPSGDRRMGKNPHAYGGTIRRDLDLPHWQGYGPKFDAPGSAREQQHARARPISARRDAPNRGDAQLPHRLPRRA